MQRERERES